MVSVRFLRGTSSSPASATLRYCICSRSKNMRRNWFALKSFQLLEPLGPWKVTSPVCARSEEHTSELQSLMRISYAVFCLKQKKYTKNYTDKYISQSNNETK